jgi:hypothetical protein
MRPILLALAVLLTFSARAQYSIGTIYRPLAIATPAGGDTCSRTWYDPDVHLLPNGTDLGVLAQTSTTSYCTDVSVDSIYSGSRNGANGAWTLPGLVDDHANVCPLLQGQYTRCGFDTGFHAGPLASPSIVRLEHPDSATGVRYYMAFVGGNADYIHGKIYWAVSDDGESWDVDAPEAPELWSPVIEAKYTRSNVTPFSALPCGRPSGIGQVQLAFENGRFYLFFQYYHSEADDPTYNHALSSVLYRFEYDAEDPFGRGEEAGEIYLDGRWQRHSGQLVWAYDKAPGGPQLPPNDADPVLQLYNGVDTAGFRFGTGDVKFGNGRWLHAYVFAHVMYAQTAASLDPTVARWSESEVVDVTPLRELHPLSTSSPAPGIWYGALSGTPEKWWIWAPVPAEDKLCAGATVPINPFGGLALAPAVLCTPDRPCD